MKEGDKIEFVDNRMVDIRKKDTFSYIYLCLDNNLYRIHTTVIKEYLGKIRQVENYIIVSGDEIFKLNDNNND